VLVSLGILVAVTLGATAYYATATRATPDANDVRLDAIEPDVAAAKGEVAKLREEVARLGAEGETRLAELERRVGDLEAARPGAGRLNRVRRPGLAPGSAADRFVEELSRNVGDGRLALEPRSAADRFVEELREAVSLTDEQAKSVREILESMKPDVDAVRARRLEARDGGMVTFFGDGGATGELQTRLRERIAAALTDGQRPAFEELAARRGLPLIGTHSVTRVSGAGGVNVNATVIQVQEEAGPDVPHAAPAPPPPDEPEF
jgi:hypothetical protein